MDYRRIYDALIKRGQNRDLLGYTETHHIIPKCMGGSDDLYNLVVLTPEEHYVAHQLLVKIYPNFGALAFAINIMSRKGTGNKSYGWCRRAFRAAIKESHPAKGKKRKDIEFDEKASELDRLRGKGYDIFRFINDNQTNDNNPILPGVVRIYADQSVPNMPSTAEILRGINKAKNTVRLDGWSNRRKQPSLW